MMEYKVIIPNWKNSFLKAQKTNAKYWLWKDKSKLPKKYSTQLKSEPLIKSGQAYCVDLQGDRLIKNTKKAGTPNLWILNGQDLYNATLNWRLRKTIAKYYHEYFSDFICDQLCPIDIPHGYFLSISCDIFEIKRGNMPDISNMWLLEKFFEDSLQECGIIPNDNCDYVIESGRKRYHFVEKIEERKLIFTIKLIQ